MKLIVGLGNPDKKYLETWHNLGFIAIDQIAKKYLPESANFKLNKKFKAEISEWNYLEEKIVLVKPQTYMNNSGQAVKALMNFYKIKIDDLWIIHDDIDLPLGKIRISHNASAAGHKGVQSIIDEIGEQGFVRFRLGIQPQTALRLPTEDYVLQKINQEAKVALDDMIQEITSAIEICLMQGVSETMNEFN
jgi:PTH1 family peptidyl-tRNA hydrolase